MYITCSSPSTSEPSQIYVNNVWNLRWLKTVSSTFLDIDFDGSLLPLFINWCYNHGNKKLPNHWWTRWYHFRDTICYHGNIITCLKKTVISSLSAYILKTARWKFFLISNFDKQDKMQRLAKFKKILYMGFRATLTFRRFWGGSEPHVQHFFKLCQKLRLIMLIKCW